jgi:hypothetical protein
MTTDLEGALMTETTGVTRHGGDLSDVLAMLFMSGLCLIAFIVCGPLFGAMILVMCSPFLAAYFYALGCAIVHAIRALRASQRTGSA